MRRLIFLSLFLMLAGLARAAHADVSPERIARLISDDYARQSHEALNSGDRVAAIIAAFKAVPADPTDADLEVFAEGFGALLRAAVSQSVRLPIELWQHAAFSPAGGRVVTADILPLDEGQRTTGLVLWNTQNGAKVADLLPASDIATGGWGATLPAFSPDGRYVAATAQATGQLVVFDATTGQRLATFDAFEPGSGLGQPVFSADGTRFAAAGSSFRQMRFFETGTWRALGQYQAAGQYAFIMPIPGGAGGDIYALERRGLAVGTYEVGIVQHTPGGATEVVTFRDAATGPTVVGEPGIEQVDPSGQYFLLRNASFDAIVVGRDERQVLAIPIGTNGDFRVRFAQSQQAVLVGTGDMAHSCGPGADELYEFSGQTRPATPEDGLPINHIVFSTQGSPLGYQSATIPAYSGANMPRGLELYALVWGQLPEVLQQQIDADRVSRPD